SGAGVGHDKDVVGARREVQVPQLENVNCATCNQEAFGQAPQERGSQHQGAASHKLEQRGFSSSSSLERTCRKSPGPAFGRSFHAPVPVRLQEAALGRQLKKLGQVASGKRLAEM